MSNELKEWKIKGPTGLQTGPASEPAIRIVDVGIPKANIHFCAGGDTVKIEQDAIYINDEPVTEIGDKGLDIIRRALLAAYPPR